MKALKIVWVVLLLSMSLSSAYSQAGAIALTAYELRMNGDADAALLMLDSALVLYPDSAILWFEKGRYMDWIKTDGCDKFTQTWTKMTPRIRASRKCFRKACRLEPNNARYHFWASQVTQTIALVDIYTPWRWPLFLPDVRNGIKHNRKAVELAPESLEYRFSLVNYEHFGWPLGGNKKRARIQADILMTLDSVHGVMAMELISTRKAPYDDITQLLVLERNNPNNPFLLKQIAIAYDVQDTLEKIIIESYCRKILVLDPGEFWAINQLSRCLPKERASELVPYLDAYLLLIDSGYDYYKAEGLRLKGRAYRAMGETEKANHCLSEATRIYPNGNGTFIKDYGRP